MMQTGKAQLRCTAKAEETTTDMPRVDPTDFGNIARRAWGQPVLRWAGSKRKLLGLLMALSPDDFMRYVEPFAGSACLFFALRPQNAVLGDMNDQLIRSYHVLRDHPRLLWRETMAYPHQADDYYRIRDSKQDDLTVLQQAARFIYLNRFCFNGLYRTNRAGAFNVPYGQKTGGLPCEQVFYRASVALRNAKLVSCDFGELLGDIREGDFVYLDPPYAAPGKRDRNEYGVGSFSMDDIPRLVDTLNVIDSHHAAFVLSYCFSEPLLAATNQYTQVRLRVQRHIAGFSKFRGMAEEVIITNRTLPRGLINAS